MIIFLSMLNPFLFAIVALAASNFLGAYAQADPITRTVVENYNLPESPRSDEQLQMILIQYEPGAAAPPHFHPVVGLNYIVEGCAESQYEGESLKTICAGDHYQDPANKKHLIFRNASKTKPLKFLVACKIRKGQSYAIKLPEN